MRRAIGVIVILLVLGLWLGNSLHLQQSVGGDDATARAQLTAVVLPTPSPTP